MSSLVCLWKQPCLGSGWISLGVPPGLIFSLLYLIIRTGLFLYVDVQCRARGTAAVTAMSSELEPLCSVGSGWGAVGQSA